MLIISFASKSQNVGIGTSNPNPSAKLEISSNNSGFLPPRMSYNQRNAIQNPAAGLIIFCTDCRTTSGEVQYFDGQTWASMYAGPASVPLLTPTISINNFDSLYAQFVYVNSTISSDGGSPILERGICWSTTANPTTALSTKTQDGNSIGTLNSYVTGLLPATSYHFRAYATNAIGTSYSMDTLITTPAVSVPVFSSSVNTDIQINVANFNSVISYDGGSPVIFRGICWSTNPNPTISLTTKTFDGSGIGAYTSTITGLPFSSTYYVRAYAINSIGVNYGPEITINTISQTFRKKIIVEQLGGAWSGFDTRVTYKLDDYRNNHPECIVTRIHGGAGVDPMKFQFYPTFLNNFFISGYPKSILNRRNKGNNDYLWGEGNSELNEALADTAVLGLSINSSYADSVISGSVKVKFGMNINDSLKIVISLVENGIVYPQINYYSPQYGYIPYLYGGENPITNFVHNYVLRKTSTNLLGDLIPLANQTSGNIYELPFSFHIRGNVYGGGDFIANPSKSAIIAFVLDANNQMKGVYNVQYAEVGSTVNFEVLQ